MDIYQDVFPALRNYIVSRLNLLNKCVDVELYLDPIDYHIIYIKFSKNIYYNKNYHIEDRIKSIISHLKLNKKYLDINNKYGIFIKYYRYKDSNFPFEIIAKLDFRYNFSKYSINPTESLIDLLSPEILAYILQDANAFTIYNLDKVYSFKDDIFRMIIINKLSNFKNSILSKSILNYLFTIISTSNNIKWLTIYLYIIRYLSEDYSNLIFYNKTQNTIYEAIYSSYLLSSHNRCIPMLKIIIEKYPFVFENTNFIDIVFSDKRDFYYASIDCILENHLIHMFNNLIYQDFHFIDVILKRRYYYKSIENIYNLLNWALSENFQICSKINNKMLLQMIYNSGYNLNINHITNYKDISYLEWFLGIGKNKYGIINTKGKYIINKEDELNHITDYIIEFFNNKKIKSEYIIRLIKLISLNNSLFEHKLFNKIIKNYRS